MMWYIFAVILFVTWPMAEATHWQKSAKWRQISSKTPAKLQQENVQSLIRRLVGSEKAEIFEVVVDSSIAPVDRDRAVVTSTKDISCFSDKVSYESEQFSCTNSTKIRIRASSGIAAAMGFQKFLKDYCNSHVSWEFTRIDIPTNLPGAINFTVTTADKFRYMDNVCTFGYTYVFWNWTRWERHIDWMALNGINLPLAFIGQEAIWERVWKKFGLTEADLKDHFAGPAFLPWQRMGNLNSFGGPLPIGWTKFTLNLQHQILTRMRGLGMTPVLPAFSGFVPTAFEVHYPKSKFHHESWMWFNQTVMLDPLDSKFAEIGSLFIKEYVKEFGETDHVYNCDLYNEMNPDNSTEAYISESGAAVYKAMLLSDPKAVWMMQGWLFQSDFWLGNNSARARALLESVEIGSMIVLDLDSTSDEHYTQLHSYFGQPFIFNDLNNFGGQMGINGRIDGINSLLVEARNIVNSTMVGVGYTPEGLPDSYITTDLLFEMGYRTDSVDLKKWTQSYATRRYGQSNKNASDAWIALLPKVLNSTGTFCAKNLLNELPALNNVPGMPNHLPDIAYAWDKIIGAADILGHNDGYRHDLTDITQDALTNLAPKYYYAVMDGYKRRNISAMVPKITNFTNLLADLDYILGTNKDFLLGTWIDRAKGVAAGNKTEEDLYEYNARNQITLWGSRGQIIDYANKQWSGLITDYYLPRWSMFFDYLVQDVAGGKPFNQVKFTADFMLKIGHPFCHDFSKTYPMNTKDDTISVAKLLHKKWRGEMV